MYSPTTSPYGYSSFPKEEIRDTIDFLVSPNRGRTDFLVSPPKNVNRIVADGIVFSFSKSVEL